LGSDKDYTSSATSSHRYTTIIITSSIEFLPNDFEFILTLLATDNFINFFEGLHQSAVVFLLFVQFGALELLDEYFLYVL